MNSFFEILEKDQKGRFVKFLKSKNKVNDTKNVELFYAIESSKEKNIEKQIGPNAYRGLKKRLMDNLINFLAEDLIRKEVTEELKIIKQLVVARKLMEMNYFREGFKLLNKLRLRAEKIGYYSLINEVYHTQIQFSFHELAPNQEQLFQGLLSNSKAQLNQEKLNMAFAKIKKEIKQTSNVKNLINSVYKKFEVDLNEGFNFKSLYQLAELANSEGAYSYDYYSVNLFFEDKVEEIIGSKLDLPKHYTYKADLLLTLANIYLRKRHFMKSELYIQKAQIVLNECMIEFRKSREYQIKTLQSLCLTYSGRLNESIELLINLNTEDLKSAYANLVLASNLFLKGEIKMAKSLIGKYYRSDSYYENNLDREWVLNKIYIEIIIAIETGDIDYAESRMNSLIRRYGAYLKTQPQSHIIRFVKLVRYYCRYPEEVTSEKFATKVDTTIKWKPSEQEDLFLMTIFAWLKSKMQKKNLYKVVLKLVSNSSKKNN